MLHARSAATSRALDGTCALCFCEVHAGGRNSVTLQCGHTFHFGESSGCRGLSAWAKQMCPLCRQPFADTDTPSVETALQLEVAWPEA
jgi:hypothetical protein